MGFVGKASLLTVSLLSHCTAPAADRGPVLTVPAIGLSRPVVVGDQPEIDHGNVVNYGRDEGCWPGHGCTIWIAGHRTSHGGVFRKVPDLKTGDELLLRYDGSTFVYVVTEIALVVRADPPPDFLRGDLMVQTSWTQGRVWLVYAELAAL